jgi:predicted RNA binding protein YcfA (HicA-like mRNA interferase family)
MTLTGQPARKKALRTLRKLGWSLRRQGKGNHEIWEAPNGRVVSLPGDAYHNHPLKHFYIKQINAVMAG